MLPTLDSPENPEGKRHQGQMFVACAILLRTEISDTQKVLSSRTHDRLWLFLTGAVTVLPSEHLCSWELLQRREKRILTGRSLWPALLIHRRPTPGVLTCVCRELAGIMPGKLSQAASDGPPCHCGVTLLSLG